MTALLAAGCGSSCPSGFGDFPPRAALEPFVDPDLKRPAAVEEVCAVDASACPPVSSLPIEDLRRAGERSLWVRARADPRLVAYRFTAIQSNTLPSGEIFRVERRGDGVPLMVLVRSALCGHGSGRESWQTVSRTLDPTGWERTKSCIERNTPPEGDGMPVRTGMDGASCFLETVGAGRHRVVELADGASCDRGALSRCFAAER